MRKPTVDLPWAVCKLAFDYEGSDIDRVWAELGAYAEKRLPEHWHLRETDGTGARSWVVVFEVDVIPTIADGEKVKALLSQIAKGEKASRHSLIRRYTCENLQ